MVSRLGAVASDQQAAEREHIRAQAVNRTCRRVSAVQVALWSFRARQQRNSSAACRCTLARSMV